MSMPTFRLLHPIFHDPRTGLCYGPGDVLPLDVWQRIGGKATVVPITDSASEEVAPAKAAAPEPAAPLFSVTVQGGKPTAEHPRDPWVIDYEISGISIKCDRGYEGDAMKLALDAAPRILDRMDYQRMQQENRVEVARDTLRDAIMGDDDAERDHAADVIEDLAAWLNAVTDEADPDADDAEFKQAADACGLTEAFRRAEAKALSLGSAMIRVTYGHGEGLRYEAVQDPAR